MNTIGKIFLSLLSIVTGAVFLYSAYTKAYTLSSFETFQFTIVEYLHFPWMLAELTAPFMIGIETAIGTLLVFNLFGKNTWVLKAATALILVFSIYLVYLWTVAGNNINCGCFGDAIWMSPLASLIKNAVLFIAILVLIIYHKGLSFRRNAWVIALISLASVVVPFLMYPPMNGEPEWLKKDHFELDMSSFYTAGKADTPKTDLRKGKHVIAFFSLACPHCRTAAYKMHIMKQKNPSLPLHMILAGKDENLAPFYKETKADNIPATRLDANTFTGLVGYSWPVIYYVNNGWVDAQTNYIQMSQATIEDWLAKP